MKIILAGIVILTVLAATLLVTPAYAGSPRIDLLIAKSVYAPNETIQIIGFYRPSTIVHVDLVDPNYVIQNSTLLQSDDLGNFQKKFVIPGDAINGTWTVNATSGLVHDTRYITVLSSNYHENKTHLNNSKLATLSNNFMPPLKQFKSGIAAKDVKCDEGFQAIWKTEDGSPACVKPDTARILLERGWAQPVPPVTEKKPQEILPTTNTNNTKNLLLDKKNQSVEVVSIQMVPPTNPGGPRIQLTLMNISMKPITNLKAIYDNNTDYTFNFKDVMQSKPLLPYHSTSDIEILVGAGFSTGLTYPLIIIGTMDNETFTYTENIHSH